MRFAPLLILPFLVLLVENCTPEAPDAESANRSEAQALQPADTITEEEKIVSKEPQLTYRFAYKKDWSRKDSFEGFAHQELITAINRTDKKHLLRLDSFLMPNVFNEKLSLYFPFPQKAACLTGISKLIIFSYATQSFAAYENGALVLSGPTSMGKKSTPTPTGLFFCNWKSKETRSTVDPSWILKWNFNVSNFGGVGFHQYDLPGYPASHSCLRLLAEQAEFLYTWADQWILKGGNLMAHGTPVLIYGQYPFGKPRPWFALAQDAAALDIKEEDLAKIIEPHLEKILLAQQTRIDYLQPSE